MALNPKAAEEGSSPASDVDNLDAENQNNADTQKSDEGQAAEESSSTADDNKAAIPEDKFDPLSVVKKALKKEDDGDGGADGDQSKQTDKSSKSENGNQKPEDANEPLGDVTQEELDSYKPKTRKRIEGLLDDRQRLTERNAALEPAAEQMETLQNFMQERQLTPQNVSELLVVGGLAMSGDPKDLKAALTRVDAFRNQIATQLGEVLPEDLQKKVDDGLLDAETAKGVALERVENQRSRVTAEKATQTVDTVSEEKKASDEKAAAVIVHSAISEWQQQKFKSDPDYPRKAELLQKEIKLRVNAEGGKVLDKAKAVKIAEEAYTEVNRLYKALNPSTNKQPKRVLQSKANFGNMASVPNSALEAAKAGLAKTHGG